MNLRQEYKDIQERFLFDDTETSAACEFVAALIQLQADYLKETEPEATKSIAELETAEPIAFHAQNDLLKTLDNTFE